MDKLKAITIFVEIADCGSMSAAARSLGVVNSVVSKNLNELEAWLDKKLVYRSTRHLRLTQDGELYLQQCRKILEDVAWLEERANEQGGVLSGHLRVAMPTFLGRKYLPPLLDTFYQENPNISLDVIVDDHFENLVDSGFDVALRASQMPDSAYLTKRIAQIRLLTIAAPSYLNDSDIPGKPKDLQKHRCILESSSTGHQLWRFTGKKKAQSHVQVAGGIAANSGTMVKELCIRGMGIAQLPDFMVRDDLMRGSLVEVLEGFALDNFYVHLLYHQNSTGNPGVRALIDHLYRGLRDVLYVPPSS